MQVFDTPDQIDMFQLITLKGALKLECAGLNMGYSPSPYDICKRTYGLEGTKKEVLSQMEAIAKKAIG